MNLYVIRHADAGNRDEWEGDDADRPLSELGHHQARVLGEAFHRNGLAADALLTSPLVRAWQTAAGFRDGARLAKDPEHCELLAPEAGRKRKLAKTLAKLGAENVAIVGHDPELPAFVGWLIGCGPGNVYLEKGAAALVRFEYGIEKGGGQLVWVVSPEWYTAAVGA
jgi:phosphohistidine phosphatase